MGGERVAQWEDRPVEEWRERWRAPHLHIYRSIGSTNDAVRVLAGEGAPAGTIVIAGEQTRGRGRRGRAWASAAGQGLFLSMLMRPRSDQPASSVTLRLGLAAALAIEEVAPVRVALKWPNDLLIGSRKVAGILCEGAFEGERAAHAVAGIGINVRQGEDDWPPDLARTATSIVAASRRQEAAGKRGRDGHGAEVSPAAVADRLVPRWLEVASARGEPLGNAEADEIRARDALLGREVTVEGRAAGAAVGIDRDGALLVLDHGQTRRVVSGTVRPVDSEERREEAS